MHKREIKKYLLKKTKPTTVQICRLENIEHKSMKQVSYSGKYSLSGENKNRQARNLLQHRKRG